MCQIHNKPVKRCVKSCQSFVSPAQPSVLALLLRAPATPTAPRGDDVHELQLGAKARSAQEQDAHVRVSVTERLWQSKSCVIKMSLSPLSKHVLAWSQSRGFGVEVEAAEDARPKLDAEWRAVNPCDHLRGA